MNKSFLHTRLKRFLNGLLEDILFVESRNINRARQKQALHETAKFVNEHLPRAYAFESRYEVYRYIAQFVPQSDDGLICEFGVAGGKSIRSLAELFPHRSIYGFDSFEGLPEDWANLRKGEYRQPLPKVPANVILVKGWFEETLPSFLAEHKGMADFLNVDCDLYSSARTVLEHYGARIQPGTVICFDDFFNYPGWKTDGEYRAFSEYLSQSGFGVEYLAFHNRGTQVALRIVA